MNMDKNLVRSPRRLAPLFLAVAVCALAAAPFSRARADMAWQYSTTVMLKVGGSERRIGGTGKSISLKYNVLRVDEPSNGLVSFYNFSNNSSVLVDLRGRTFVKMPLDVLMAEASRGIQDIKQELPKREADLQGMTGDERDVLAAQIEAQKIKFELWGTHAYQVRPTTETAEVLGHRCKKYEGLSGDTVFQEIWATDDFPLDPAYTQYFARYMNRLEPDSFAHLSRIQGFPIRVVSRYGPVTVTAECTNISTAALPVDAFTLPDGLVESPLVNRQP
jgi:hypothetical protein